MIGGLESKLTGAKRAGIRLALVPKENFRELSIIKKKNLDLIDSNFRVVMISTIDDVIKYIF
jgi:predicted ATP-dependent protease